MTCPAPLTHGQVLVLVLASGVVLELGPSFEESGF